MEAKDAHLLVVDDNEMNRDMLSRRLEKTGFRVSVAADGSAALHLIENGGFDLILLDVMMPGISGIEVLKDVRLHHSSSELPIIMVTAKDSSEDIVAALKLGANDYVTKPLDFPVVLARCKTQLRVRFANDEIRSLNRQLEDRNRFIRDTFGRYVSNDVVQSVLDSPGGLELGGEKRVVTLMMADLRGFAAMCERLDPQQVVRILNLYLGAMTEVITRFGGTIDEFIGDGIFVMFGAPVPTEDHAHQAVACALAMQMALACVNDQLEEEGLQEVTMGIGIHTGEVVVGNVGSEQRTKFGAVGRNVNVTGRIETYSVGGQVLVSESTREILGDDLMWKGSVSMEGKGLRRPIEVFDVNGLTSEGLHLMDKEPALEDLGEPLPVTIQPLDGKHLRTEQYDGNVIRLSRSVAEIACDVDMPLWSNLQIHFESVSGIDGVYAKVVRHVDGNGSQFCARFTSSAKSVAMVLKQVSLD